MVGRTLPWPETSASLGLPFLLGTLCSQQGGLSQAQGTNRGWPCRHWADSGPVRPKRWLLGIGRACIPKGMRGNSWGHCCQEMGLWEGWKLGAGGRRGWAFCAQN